MKCRGDVVMKRYGMEQMAARRKKQQGFTAIELIVVLVVIAVLVAAFYNVALDQDSGNFSAAESHLGRDVPSQIARLQQRGQLDEGTLEGELTSDPDTGSAWDGAFTVDSVSGGRIDVTYGLDGARDVDDTCERLANNLEDNSNVEGRPDCGGDQITVTYYQY